MAPKTAVKTEQSQTCLHKAFALGKAKPTYGLHSYDEQTKPRLSRRKYVDQKMLRSRDLRTRHKLCGECHSPSQSVRRSSSFITSKQTASQQCLLNRDISMLQIMSTSNKGLILTVLVSDTDF